ncbi:MAG: hypothetical protein DCC43_13120 [Candidatus Brocadia sp.]|nr:MAG: hypothetical protein DCC43_13120 [Candidatus Brocadia sp.]
MSVLALILDVALIETVAQNQRKTGGNVKYKRRRFNINRGDLMMKVALSKARSASSVKIIFTEFRISLYVSLWKRF